MSTDVIRLGEIDSTSLEAARRAPHLTRPTWIVAERQTAARGRRGRAWHMPTGNFAGTLVLFPECPPAKMALRSFTAALALHDALGAVTGTPDLFALKWPNDVLMEEGKVAGILLETAGNALLVGIGINLSEAPPTGDVEPDAVPPVSLAPRFGVAPDDMLSVLDPSMAVWERRLRDEGFAPVREAWQSRAARLGRTIRARTGTQERSGTFEGIAEDGALVLATAAGRESIPAAEVHF